MAALLLDVKPQRVCEVGWALRCSNEQIDSLNWLVGSEPMLHRVSELTLAQFKRLLGRPRWSDLLSLHKASITSSSLAPGTYDAAIDRASRIPADQIAPKPLVTGEDLLGLGLQPGPKYKEILETLYDAQLNGELRDREFALSRLSKLARNE